MNNASIDSLALPNGVANMFGTATQGFGVPAIYKQNSLIGQTNAIASIVTLTPASIGVFWIQITVNVTAWTTPASFTAQCTYTDDNGTAQTETLAFNKGSTGAAVAAVTTVDRYYGDGIMIRSNPSAAITVLTTGTFTGSPVYNVVANIIQVA